MTRPVDVITRRERRRADTVQEILDAAEQQLAQHGPQGLAFRAVAREVGMTVQSLYHYFDSRDDMVTALVAAAHTGLAEAVEAARDAHPGAGRRVRLLAASEAYRHWAVSYPRRFQLAYGMPLADYEAPADGPTTRAARRVGSVFVELIFAGWSDVQLQQVALTRGAPDLDAVLRSLPKEFVADLPPGATALALTMWSRMHGLVVLEVFGHMRWLGDQAGALFSAAMSELADDVERYAPAS